MAMAEDAQKKETNEFLEDVFNMARKQGCTFVSGNINTTKERATERMLGHIRRGYKIHSNDGDYITMIKEI